ncbi:MAG: AraC family transcriptional regulator [Paenibacillaceae bacterium]|jgi:AraC-like DNA-binding protein|nr:AraC family transcriptional regulator [Paenibacillaceae bacterium]
MSHSQEIWFKMSRLCRLDVKWTGFDQGNTPLASYEHSNPYYEILMVTEGPIYLQTESEQLELVSGDCFLLTPWERHTAWKLTHEHAGFFWVQFFATPGPSLCRPDELPGMESINWPDRSRQELRTGQDEEVEHLLLPRHFQPVRRYELLNLFEKLHGEMEHPQGYFRYRSSLLLGQILHLIAEDLLNKEQLRTVVPAAFLAYRQLVNLLNESYNRELDRDFFERELNRKYEYLCHIFKKYSGLSIFTYIHQLRIQRAQYLLLNSELEVKQIAESVGFADPYYFSRLFKRFSLCSPTDFRKQNGQFGK